MRVKIGVQKRIDKWPKEIPYTPKIHDYGACFGAETNRIVAQRGLKNEGMKINGKVISLQILR